MNFKHYFSMNLLWWGLLCSCIIQASESPNATLKSYEQCSRSVPSHKEVIEGCTDIIDAQSVAISRDGKRNAPSLDSMPAYLIRAEAFIYAGEYQKAMADLQVYHPYYRPQESSFYFLRGSTYFALQEYEKAANDFSAFVYEHQNPTSHASLAWWYIAKRMSGQPVPPEWKEIAERERMENYTAAVESLYMGKLNSHQLYQLGQIKGGEKIGIYLWFYLAMYEYVEGRKDRAEKLFSYISSREIISACDIECRHEVWGSKLMLKLIQ